MADQIRTIGIIGPGLLGGSVAMAARKHLPSVSIRTWARRDEPLQFLSKHHLSDFISTDLQQVVGPCDLIILATPVEYMEKLLGEMILSPQTIVTDVGSVKGDLVNKLQIVISDQPAEFVGSHPMAGSDKTGVENACSELFEGAMTIITPHSENTEAAVATVESFWTSLGSRVARIDPHEHDQIVAEVSHLPHVLAAILVESVMGKSDSASEVVNRFCGNGFRDTTRIAAGDAAMWAGILTENQTEVISAIDSYILELSQFRKALEQLDKEALQSFLSRAADLRKNLN